MLSFKEAQAKVLSQKFAARRGKLDIGLLPGLVLSRDIISPRDLPAADIAAVDGYALRAIDSKGADRNYPIRLKACEGARGSQTNGGSGIEPGFCVSVSAGMAIPGGCDCVVSRESIESERRDILVYAECSSQSNIIRKGQDTKKGDRLFCAGRQIYPQDIGVFAQIGVEQAEVFLPPKVGLAALYGQEGQKDHNLDACCMLAAMARDVKAECSISRIHINDGKKAAKTMAGLLDACDLVVVAGNQSVPGYDFLNDTMLGLDLDLGFWKVNQHPGRQMAFLAGKNKAAFCLGDRLDEILFCFELYIRPMILNMMGNRDVFRKTVRGQAREDIIHKKGKTLFLTVCLGSKKGSYTFSPTHPQRALRSVRDAQGIVVLPENKAGLKAGDLADIIMIKESG